MFPSKTIKNTAKAETTETENFNGASGISGALTWNITTEGHLTIEGNGDYREDVSWENLPEWLEYKQYIKTATVNVQNITSTIFMFLDCSNLTDINLTNLDTSNITDMSYMFIGCSNLTSLDISSFDTRNVKHYGTYV